MALSLNGLEVGMDETVRTESPPTSLVFVLPSLGWKLAVLGVIGESTFPPPPRSDHLFDFKSPKPRARSWEHLQMTSAESWKFLNPPHPIVYPSSLPLVLSWVSPSSLLHEQTSFYMPSLAAHVPFEVGMEP